MTDAAKQQTSPLPLVRLSLILPFVEELDRRKIDPDAVLASNGLARQAVTDTNVFVPAIVVHRFLEDAAHAADDPHFGVCVGERLDLSGWPPFLDAVAHSSMLIDFLARFIQAVKDQASSAYHTLEITQDWALFKEIRTSSPEISPAQNDAFTAAYTLNLVRSGAGSDWDPKEVRVKVCAPEVIPKRYLGVTVVGGDRLGMIVRFPVQWLLHPLVRKRFVKSVTPKTLGFTPPRDFMSVLRSILVLHLDRPDLNVDYVARLFGVSRQSLQRKLKANGTTLLKEIAALKKSRACDDLARTNKSISEISTSLGFGSAVSFTRAFKSWTNQSPSDYRKSHRSR
jgi:AraC-like DNA-binding protein